MGFGLPALDTINAKKSTISCIEIEGMVIPVDNLELTLNATWNRGRIKKYEDVILSPAWGNDKYSQRRPGSYNCGDPQQNNVLLYQLNRCNIDRSHENLPRLAKRVFFASAQYHIQTPAGIFTPRIQGSWKFDQENCFDYSSCQSGLWNTRKQFDLSARLTWLSLDEHWMAALYGSNLTKEKYVVGGTPLVDNVGYGGITFNPPRMYGAEVQYRWLVLPRSAARPAPAGAGCFLLLPDLPLAVRAASIGTRLSPPCSARRRLGSLGRVGHSGPPGPRSQPQRLDHRQLPEGSGRGGVGKQSLQTLPLTPALGIALGLALPVQHAEAMSQLIDPTKLKAQTGLPHHLQRAATGRAGDRQVGHHGLQQHHAEGLPVRTEHKAVEGLKILPGLGHHAGKHHPLPHPELPGQRLELCLQPPLAHEHQQGAIQLLVDPGKGTNQRGLVLVGVQPADVAEHVGGRRQPQPQAGLLPRQQTLPQRLGIDAIVQDRKSVV